MLGEQREKEKQSTEVKDDLSNEKEEVKTDTREKEKLETLLKELDDRTEQCEINN